MNMHDFPLTPAHVHGILERAGADAGAPEGSQAWALAQVDSATAELIERLRASNWRLENLLAMMPTDRPERDDIERDLEENRAALAGIGGAAWTRRSPWTRITSP